MTMRRLLIIIIILTLIAGGVWFFFFKDTQNDSQNPGEGGLFRSVFPLVNRGGSNTESATVSFVENTEENNSPLKKIIASPVAGVTAYTISREVSIPSDDPKKPPTKETVVERIVRFVSRSNGYVYEIKNEGRPLQITNTYIPNIYEAFFVDAGSTAIVRFLRNNYRTIATYAIPIPLQNPDGSRTQKQGVAFPDGITSIAPSPSTTSLLWKSTNGGDAVIASSSALGLAKKELYRSPFHEWLVLPTNTVSYIQTKASGQSDGFLYAINQNKQLSRVLGNIRGLTASVSPKGNFVIYSESINSSFVTKLFSQKDGTTKQLPVAILPEKCIWLANEDLFCAGSNNIQPGTYPDVWYAGTVAFTDNFYRVYAQAGVIDTLFEPTVELVDAVTLAVDEAANTLYFINKTDGSLWQLRYDS